MKCDWCLETFKGKTTIVLAGDSQTGKIMEFTVCVTHIRIIKENWDTRTPGEPIYWTYNQGQSKFAFDVYEYIDEPDL